MAGFKFKLWSSLMQSSKRQLFFTETASDMTEEDFLNKVEERLEANGVPAKIESCDVEWENSNEIYGSHYVKMLSNVFNPMVCLLQFNHVGKFSFVENKTFIIPPDLPKMPGKPRPVDIGAPKTAMTMGLLGAIGIGIAVFIHNPWTPTPSIIAGCIGGAFLLAAVLIYSSYSSNLAWNEQCVRDEEAWLKAWQDWQNTNLLHSFQEITNGNLSRIFDAVFETLKQVSNEVFANVRTETQTERSSMNEIEAAMQRRRDAYR